MCADCWTHMSLCRKRPRGGIPRIAGWLKNYSAARFLWMVEVAFVLGSARRLARDRKRIVPPIRCLAYFLPVIEEVLAEPPPPSYIQYLRLFHLQPRAENIVDEQ